jgi:hypothetical protein
MLDVGEDLGQIGKIEDINDISKVHENIKENLDISHIHQEIKK